ncbi:MAG TPA: acyl-CoA desaturase [Methylomirabilota bacterium]|jgi:stearoyl-CoA desaturase (delta-9 desaturase)|nr:acyl-CoA desaturase [Methylomirabilota bacterium]
MNSEAVVARPKVLALDERPNHVKSIPFYLMHILPLGALWTGTKPIDWAVCCVLYFSRMFFVTGVMHRYFAHKTYKSQRWFQAVLAFGSTLTAQKGFLWWAAWHRVHHRAPDRPDDPHDSEKGFWWSHVGWILCDKFNHTRWELVKPWLAYPELVWLNNRWWIGPTLLGVGIFLWGGWSMLFIGFFLSTALLYHGTFCINSLAHVSFLWSKTPYTGRLVGKSQNSWLLALVTMGEGWHNSHHHVFRVTKQGDKWWQIDVTYYILWTLSMIRLPWVKKADHKLGWRLIPIFVWDVTRHPKQKLQSASPNPA